MRALILFALLFAAGSLLAAAPAKIPVLIVDGQNNHQWAITTPMLKNAAMVARTVRGSPSL